MLFKKKLKGDGEINQVRDPLDVENPEEVPVIEDSTENKQSVGDGSAGKFGAEIEKLKAQFSSFYEMQKASIERFSRINEQIGELRSMILQKDKEMSIIQAKSTEAIDLVKTVQPEKLMIEVRKMDSKVESLRSNIESNGIVIKNILEEQKEMRNRLMVFKGIDEVVELSNDVKKEIMIVKKINADTERHADRVATIFAEVNKLLANINKSLDLINSLDKEFKHMISEQDNFRYKLSEMASKKDIEDLISRFHDFEKHAGDVITLINKKFKMLEENLTTKVEVSLRESKKLLDGFKELAVKTPDLNKYFNLLEKESLKVQNEVIVEKIKTPGEEDEEVSEDSEKKKGGFFSKIKGKFKAKESEEGEEPEE